MESSSRTLVCSVLFLDISEYSRKPVAEQLQLKQAFNRSLATALEQVPQRDRIILDTGDGAAVTFMGDPEDALFSALTMRNMASEVPVRLGVNLGPVRLVKDLNGQMNIIGDGINVAQRVMSFAAPGQLLVSRSFYEVVSCLSRDYLNLFRHEGSRTDKHVREHEVYSVVGGAPVTRKVAHTESSILARDGGWLAGSGPLGLRRSALIAAPLAFLLMVGGGSAARSLMDADEAARRTGMTAPSRAQPLPSMSKVSAPAKPAPAPENKLSVPATPKAAARKAAPESKAVARLETKQEPAASAAVARLEVAVLPWGEVLVDGQSRGVSPPLRALEIAPGSHTVELRNSTFPSRIEKIDVKAGEAVRIRHRFDNKK